MNTNAKNLFLLQNGFESFQKKYPFLCVSFSGKGSSLVDATLSHPFEIIPNFLYLGDIKHGQNVKQLQDLKINKIINVSDVKVLYFKEFQCIDLKYEISEDLSEIKVPILEAMRFLDKCTSDDRVLIFDFDGKVRGPILAAAYVLKDAKRMGKKINALYAWGLLEQCKPTLKITSDYFKHLKEYEEELFDETKVKKETFSEDIIEEETKSDKKIQFSEVD